jgi:phosphoglucomutase
MQQHPLAGKPVPRSLLTDIPQLVSAYYVRHPDPRDTIQQVAFGTSGHRGSSLKDSFNEDHILAITGAICLYRSAHGISGPLFLGKDTHALSEPAHTTALEVLAAHGVAVMVHADAGYTPTPVISHAILSHNRGGSTHPADGIVITPSHNGPHDGGFKYNPPHGGPADTGTTGWIERKANELLAGNNKEVPRIPYPRAMRADTTRQYDYITPYIEDLSRCVDLDAIQAAGLKMGADALGGSGIAFWGPLAERYKLHIDLFNGTVDPTFSFMTVDRDGTIRMDCSSPFAMAGLIKLRDSYDIAFGNDPDYDRHGIVTRSRGLLNPNHYLSAAIWYLFQNRPGWREDAAIGKTLVSSSMIDRVAGALGRNVCEVPVGFKWFVDGLLNGSYAFGGEESSGASFVRRDGTVWTTDKDGFIMDLLAAEMTARTGRDPGELYAALTDRFGNPVYERIDAPATSALKAALKRLAPRDITASTLAGDTITAVLTEAPGNGAAIGGIKVITQNGWFAARPSGTEDVYKMYAESFTNEDHLRLIQEEAQGIINAVVRSVG